MKIRTDFVTNSSSSSFICEICGRTESGFDSSLIAKACREGFKSKGYYWKYV